MESDGKLTHQGVRDLNYKGPKKNPAPADAPVSATASATDGGLPALLRSIAANDQIEASPEDTHA